VLSRGDKGDAVSELQARLIALGYSLPRWGADGDLGDETLNAVARFLADHGAGYVDDDPDTISNQELSIVQRVHDANAWPIPVPGVTFYDLRREADRKHDRGPRPWSQITGVTIHQTACNFGREKASRWDTLQAHVGVSREGWVNWVHDLERVVWHGHGFNHGDVGVELEGLYAGIAGHPDGSAKSETPTPELIKAAQETIRWIYETAKRHGSTLKHLHAHRQSKDSRRADPGQELWQAVALPMLAELHLSDGGPGCKLGSGRTIPESWNPVYKGSPY